MKWISVLSFSAISGSFLLFSLFSSTKADALTKIEDKARTQTLIADGERKDFRSLGLSLTPPKGWTVQATPGTGPSLVLSEPEKKATYKNPVRYRRNINVALIHQGSPIDQERAFQLRQQLEEKFGSAVDDYQISNHQLVKHSTDQQALVLYATSKMRSKEMQHMHVLFSSGEKQYLFTYSDLASRFSAQEQLLNEAWNTIMSVQLTSKAPVRTHPLHAYGSWGLLLTMVLMTLWIGRKWLASRKLKMLIEREEVFIDQESLEAHQGSSINSLSWTGMQKSPNREKRAYGKRRKKTRRVEQDRFDSGYIYQEEQNGFFSKFAGAFHSSVHDGPEQAPIPSALSDDAWQLPG